VDGLVLLRVAEERGLEGVVSKRRDAPYRSGECRDWRKVKTVAWREAKRERWWFDYCVDLPDGVFFTPGGKGCGLRAGFGALILPEPAPPVALPTLPILDASLDPASAPTAGPHHKKAIPATTIVQMPVTAFMELTFRGCHVFSKPTASPVQHTPDNHIKEARRDGGFAFGGSDNASTQQSELRTLFYLPSSPQTGKFPFRGEVRVAA